MPSEKPHSESTWTPPHSTHSTLTGMFLSASPSGCRDRRPAAASICSCRATGQMSAWSPYQDHWRICASWPARLHI
ncbi:hypothetical protein HGI15_21235 [Modestobacter lapidis]|nr:hypothetical protein [Modestobacter lapidis]